jgi:membrane protein DedA with SNARE-associated domain
MKLDYQQKIGYLYGAIVMAYILVSSWEAWAFRDSEYLGTILLLTLIFVLLLGVIALLLMKRSNKPA